MNNKNCHMKKYYWLFVTILTLVVGIGYMFIAEYSRINMLIEYIIFFTGTMFSYFLFINKNN